MVQSNGESTPRSLPAKYSIPPIPAPQMDASAARRQGRAGTIPQKALSFPWPCGYSRSHHVLTLGPMLSTLLNVHVIAHMGGPSKNPCRSEDGYSGGGSRWLGLVRAIRQLDVRGLRCSRIRSGTNNLHWKQNGPF